MSVFDYKVIPNKYVDKGAAKALVAIIFFEFNLVSNMYDSRCLYSSVIPIVSTGVWTLCTLLECMTRVFPTHVFHEI